MKSFLVLISVMSISWTAQAATVAAEFARCPKAPETVCANFYGDISAHMVPVTASQKIMKKLLAATDSPYMTIVHNVEAEKNGDQYVIINLVGNDKNAPTPK